MKIALTALVAVCFTLPGVARAESPVALYYSFDEQPSAEVFAAMTSEFDRILDASSLHVQWRHVGAPETNTDFREVFVLRFRGACQSSFETSDDSDLDVLANVKVVDGDILPFADVECNHVRRFLGPTENRALGHALARVAAHELYHMLTKSACHAKSGVARAQHSRQELLAPTFCFGKSESDRIRSWVEADRLTLARR